MKALLTDLAILYTEHPVTMGAITMTIGVVIAAIALIIGRRS